MNLYHNQMEIKNSRKIIGAIVWHKNELKCIHNKALHPEMGVVCDLRVPNSLCKNCKTFKPKYPSYCCQKCGKIIGWLGRFVEWIYCGFIKHDYTIK